MAISGFRVLGPLGTKRKNTENTGKDLTSVKKVKCSIESKLDETTKTVSGKTEEVKEKVNETKLEEGTQRRDFDILPKEIILKIFKHIPLNDIWKSVRVVNKSFHEVCEYMLIHHLVVGEGVHEKVAECIFKKYHPYIRKIYLRRTLNTNKLLEFIPQCDKLQNLKLEGCRGFENEAIYEPISVMNLQAVLYECKLLSIFEFIFSGLENLNIDSIFKALKGRYMKRLYIRETPLIILSKIQKSFLSQFKQIRNARLKEFTMEINNTTVSQENIKMSILFFDDDVPVSNFKSIPFLHDSFI